MNTNTTQPQAPSPEAVQFASQTLSGIIADLEMLYSFFSMANESGDSDIVLEVCRSMARMISRTCIQAEDVRTLVEAGFTDIAMQTTLDQAPSLYFC